MNPNTTIPLRVYGLFLEGHPELVNKIPKEIIEKASYSFKPETAIAIRTKDFFKMKDILMTGLNRLDNPLMRSKRIELLSMPRDEREFVGDYIQIIGAACIHDDKRIILLQLENAGGADGYCKGTYTYPQGHCTYTNEVDRIQASDGGFCTFDLLGQIVKENIFREIQEELTIEGEYNRVRFMNDVRNALIQSPNNGKLYSIYVDRAGTSCRHLCILADIYMDSHSCFNEVAESIISNEPSKHKVRLISFGDLLEIGSIDEICIWVAKSFSALPFMSKSFIQDFLKNMVS